MSEISGKVISFIVYGQPVAQGRPKFRRRGNFVQTYDPEKSMTYKERVYYEAIKVKPESLILEGVGVMLKIYKSMPQMSKKKYAAAKRGDYRPLTKPDSDNVYKGVVDALKGVFWKDDSQIVSARIEKYYSDAPRVEMQIWEIKQEF